MLELAWRAQCLPSEARPRELVLFLCLTNSLLARMRWILSHFRHALICPLSHCLHREHWRCMVWVAKVGKENRQRLLLGKSSPLLFYDSLTKQKSRLFIINSVSTARNAHIPPVLLVSPCARAVYLLYLSSCPRGIMPCSHSMQQKEKDSLMHPVLRYSCPCAWPFATGEHTNRKDLHADNDQSPQFTTSKLLSLITINQSTSSALPPALLALSCSSQTATSNNLVL